MPTATAFDRSMHGYRVTIGHGGPAGVLNRCFSKTTRRYYWKVRLDDGTWVWPERAVADSTGRYELRCGECPLSFRSDDPYVRYCPNCLRAIDARSGPDYDPGAGPSHQFGARRFPR